MPVIRADTNPALFDLVTKRNLEQQYYLLETMVEIGTKCPGVQQFTMELIRDLNRQAVMFLVQNPGTFREFDCEILGSDHAPPPWHDVPGEMDSYLTYLTSNWDQASPTHLAAYAMWRLTWIHPFEDGNGRAARAAAYLVLCLKHRMWLRGKRILPAQIRRQPKPYYRALQAADRAHKAGAVDLRVLERYLDRLLKIQLAS